MGKEKGVTKRLYFLEGDWEGVSSRLQKQKNKELKETKETSPTSQFFPGHIMYR